MGPAAAIGSPSKTIAASGAEFPLNASYFMRSQNGLAKAFPLKFQS